MRELNVNEIKEVNGGLRAVGWALLGYVGGKILDKLEGMGGGNGNTSSGGQMNRSRRSNMFNP